MSASTLGFSQPGYLLPSPSRPNRILDCRLRGSSAACLLEPPSQQRKGLEHGQLFAGLASASVAIVAATQARSKRDRNVWRRRQTCRSLPYDMDYSEYLHAAERLKSRDWLSTLLTLPSSTVLRRIQHPLLAMTSAAIVICWLHCVRGMPVIGTLSGHTLLGSGLSLLLAFRTNTAIARFHEGRKIWNDILDTTRCLALGLAVYREQVGFKRVKTIRALLMAFPFSMQEHVRAMKSVVMRDHLTRMLTEADMSEGGDEHFRGSNRPLRIIACMLKTIGSIPDQDNFTTRERQWLMQMVTQLSTSVGRCERLVQTPVPLSYGRHTSRFLSVWTLTLPLALVENLRWLTVPTMMVVTWALFGILEIGHMIEDPFRSSLELGPISWAICRDCERALPDEMVQLDPPVQVDSPRDAVPAAEEGQGAAGAASETLPVAVEPVAG